MARLSWLVPVGCIAALAVALGLQYIGGFAPCQMCIWERYLYLGAVFAMLAGWPLGRPRAALWTATLLLFGNAVLSGYHVGVEQGLFALPSGCAVGGEAQTVDELRAMLEAAPPSCDQVSVTFFGISLAGWNAVYSLALAVIGMIIASHFSARFDSPKKSAQPS